MVALDYSRLVAGLNYCECRRDRKVASEMQISSGEHGYGSDRSVALFAYQYRSC